MTTSPLQMIQESVDFTELDEPLRERAGQAYRLLIERTDLGFTKIPMDGAHWQAAQDLAKTFSQYKSLAIVGIGGSSVGTESVIRTLNPVEDRIIIFDTPHAIDLKRKIQNLNLRETLWYIVSKSGSTLETLYCTDFIALEYEKQGLDFKKQVVVATELRKNPLFNWATANQIPILEVPENIGGRFSSLTSVGLFPYAFCQVDLKSLRDGALLANQAEQLTIETAARILRTWELECFVTYLWFYSSEMSFFKTWLHQLWAESLGKSTGRQGQKVFASLPFVAIGPQDQHSIQQQILEGNFKKSCLFFNISAFAADVKITKSQFENSYWLQHSSGEIVQTQARSTYEACLEKKIPSLLFDFAEVNAFNIGFFIQWFHLLIGTLGEALDIDAFNQPAVEIGKKLTRQKLEKLI